MLQAIIDANGIVTDVNDWNEGVGIPCDENTQIGMQFNGSEFVESLASIVKRYDNRLLSHFDIIAAQRKYDSWQNCFLRSGLTESPFYAECKAFALWLESCNAKAIEIQNSTLSGLIATPTEDEFIALMPAMVWPN